MSVLRDLSKEDTATERWHAERRALLYKSKRNGNDTDMTERVGNDTGKDAEETE